MAGFHPAAKRRISYGDNGTKQQSENNNIIDVTPKNNVIDNNNDEIEDFSDWDEPYHETAYNWYNRHSRRRARRLAGISSSSSSSESSSDNECSEDEELDGNVADNNGGKNSKKKKDMDRAIRSANKPMEKWLASYPLVAARCCFSSISSPAQIHTMTNEYGGNNYYGNAQQQSSNINMRSRDQETKKLHRIFRRLRRKQKEFHVKFINFNAKDASSTLEEQQQTTNNNDNNTYYQKSNALSVEQMMQINQDCSIETESDQYAVHSFIPQGIGISFIDAVLESSVVQQQQQQQTKSESDKEKTLSRLVLELVRRTFLFIEIVLS